MIFNIKLIFFPISRFVYKFVCDLKQLIGYDAQELASLVNECEPNPHYDNYFAS